MSREIISRIEFKGLPAIYSSMGVTQAINLEERLVNEGYFAENTTVTEDYFKSVNQPLAYERHVIQSTLFHKWSFTIYHIENSDVDLLQYGAECKIYTLDGNSFYCRVLEKSRAAIDISQLYKTTFTVKEIATNENAINNYLISSNLLSTYKGIKSDVELYRLHIDNSNLPQVEISDTVEITYVDGIGTFLIKRDTSNFNIRLGDTIVYYYSIEELFGNAIVIDVSDIEITLTTDEFSEELTPPTTLDITYFLPKRLIFYTALAPNPRIDTPEQSAIVNDYLTRVAVTNVKKKLHLRFYLTETERENIMFYGVTANAENIKYFKAGDTTVTNTAVENPLGTIIIEDKKELIGIYECNVYLPIVSTTIKNTYNV